MDTTVLVLSKTRLKYGKKTILEILLQTLSGALLSPEDLTTTRCPNAGNNLKFYKIQCEEVI